MPNSSSIITRCGVAIASVFLVSIAVFASPSLAAKLSVHFSHHDIAMLLIDPDGQGHVPAVTRVLWPHTCTDQ
jgi:hypothetical protein